MDSRKGWIDGNAKHEDQDKEAFEYMRRKLWCDVMLLEVHSNPNAIELADVVLKKFDKRFGKGDGE